MMNHRFALAALVTAGLLVACAGTVQTDPNANGGAPATGGASTGGAMTGGASTGGIDGGIDGGMGVGGSAAMPGTGGSGASNCALVGVAAPPFCSLGCNAECGCGACVEGEVADMGGVKSQCVGGCWAPVDGVCKGVDGQLHRVGESFAAPDGCNSCSCSSNGSILCTEMACPACDPKLDSPPKNYLATELAKCLTLKFACPTNTTSFQNDCGCGCQQSAACPAWIDCMPGGADSQCSALDAFKQKCPFSTIAM